MQHRLIRERLQSEYPGVDEKTLADTVDGLTDLHEIVGAIVRSALQDEALTAGLDARIGEMRDRRDRLAERAILRRELAKDVMAECAIRKVMAPDLTASVRMGAPSLIITDEAQLPPDFWVPRSPRLDRSRLIAALKSGIVITGAALGNPEPVLSVRVA
jgi:hypothetical protein